MGGEESASEREEERKKWVGGKYAQGRNAQMLQRIAKRCTKLLRKAGKHTKRNEKHHQNKRGGIKTELLE